MDIFFLVRHGFKPLTDTNLRLCEITVSETDSEIPKTITYGRLPTFPQNFPRQILKEWEFSKIGISRGRFSRLPAERRVGRKEAPPKRI